MNVVPYQLNKRQYLELENLAFGVFDPIFAFMDESEFNSVVSKARLPTGQPFPIPIVLDLSPEDLPKILSSDLVQLEYEGTKVGELTPGDVFSCDKLSVAEQVYGTTDCTHPGVGLWMRMGEYFVSGEISLGLRSSMEYSESMYTPEETRNYFIAKGWQKVAGFQTRNVPHRAHEHLIRLALEQVDGLFIQPLVGTRKRGDYSPLAILTGYQTLIDRYLPSDRILLGVLSTTMRYAGPREALFHAIIRKNYGCTHFVMGRDHAGIGNYYGKYEAHEFARRFEQELGIEIMEFSGSFYCSVCDGIVTERSCPHQTTSPQSTQEVSGTLMREILSNSTAVDPRFMRPDIVEILQGTPIFVEEDAQ